MRKHPTVVDCKEVNSTNKVCQNGQIISPTCEPPRKPQTSSNRTFIAKKTPIDGESRELFPKKKYTHAHWKFQIALFRFEVFAFGRLSKNTDLILRWNLPLVRQHLNRRAGIFFSFSMSALKKSKIIPSPFFFFNILFFP